MSPSPINDSDFENIVSKRTASQVDPAGDEPTPSWVLTKPDFIYFLLFEKATKERKGREQRPRHRHPCKVTEKQLSFAYFILSFLEKP